MCRLSVKDYIFNPNFKDPYKLFIHNDNEMLQVSPDFSVKCPYNIQETFCTFNGINT